MPAKFLKGFPRRKSSGQVLDDVQNDHNSNRDSTASFRVLARPGSEGKSFESGSALRPMTDRPQPPRMSSFEQDNEHRFSVVRDDAPNRYDRPPPPSTLPLTVTAAAVAPPTLYPLSNTTVLLLPPD